ncbi:hypothetical protein BGZ51_006839 [Haplosporangium sp. Z 767]|nr:hypothetical protein BGZ51_006839 [Haplosporangium sp. Z 767]KAF9188299.1 hypothetical protein BGZ50_001414 [Haplosporangium sp. Z 11]
MADPGLRIYSPIYGGYLKNVFFPGLPPGYSLLRISKFEADVFELVRAEGFVPAFRIQTAKSDINVVTYQGRIAGSITHEQIWHIQDMGNGESMISLPDRSLYWTAYGDEVVLRPVTGSIEQRFRFLHV